MYGEALLETLIQGIYEAAVGTAGWLTFLLSLATALDSGSPSIYFADSSGREGTIEVSIGMDDKMRRAYHDHYHSRNVWIQGARPLLLPGVVRSSNLICPRRVFLRSEWYADFCKPLNWTQGLGATILADGTMTANIGVFADNRRLPYGEEDFALMRALMPHLQRGLKMHMHLSKTRARGQALEAVLNGLSSPVLLVTTDGQVLFANVAGERLIRTSDGLVVKGDKLRTLLSDETKALRRAIAAAVQTSSGLGPKSGGALRVSRPYGRQALELLVSPLPTWQDEWSLGRRPVAAVFVTDRSSIAVSAESALIRLHGLTGMEAKVAIAVARGLAGKEACRELDIRYNTLKTHLKRIYAKTRTKNQSELVRLLVAGPTFVGPDHAGDV